MSFLFVFACFFYRNTSLQLTKKGLISGSLYFGLCWVFVKVWASRRADFPCCGARALGKWAVVAANRLSCPAARGNFLSQGWNLCLPHWQEDSSPLGHQGRPQGCSFLCSVLTYFKTDCELCGLWEELLAQSASCSLLPLWCPTSAVTQLSFFSCPKPYPLLTPGVSSHVVCCGMGDGAQGEGSNVLFFPRPWAWGTLPLSLDSQLEDQAFGSARLTLRAWVWVSGWQEDAGSWETTPSGAWSPWHLGLELGRVPAYCLNPKLQSFGEVCLLPALLPTTLRSLWANCCGLSYASVRTVSERSRAPGVASVCIRSAAGERGWMPLFTHGCHSCRADSGPLSWEHPMFCLVGVLRAHGS